jgi:IS1 family transposase
MSQRSCERIFRVSNKTVAKLFAEAGDMAITYMKSLRGLTPKRIQADELHTFVAIKEKNLPMSCPPMSGAGTIWAYLAVCADTKLIISYRLGDRDIPNATEFAKDVLVKLKRTENGELAVRPLIVTDGLGAYHEAFETVFGDEADRGMLIKRYERVERDGEQTRKRYVGADREVLAGSPKEADIHTSYIERQNLNLRMGNRRYNRRTNAFSKTILNHERHLALWIMYHNLCWVPCPMRPTADEDGVISKNWEKRLPAAMAAGLEDRLWDIEDLLALTDTFTAKRKAAAKPIEHEAVAATSSPETPSTARYWVYRDLLKRTTKVHAASCTNCRNGQGKKPGVKAHGQWLPFLSLETATAEAEALEPDRNSICRMCLEEPNTLGYRHVGSSRQAGNPSHFI